MIRTSESVAAISAAWATASASMPTVPRRTKGQVGNATRFYADLATVVETIQPVLAEHDLAYVQGCSDGDKVVTVTTRLMHKSGEWMESSLSMPIGQGTAQAVGSAISYARRYSLMAMLGLAPDDDDGAAASVQPRQQRSGGGHATEAQITKLATAFTRFGVKQRDERLRYLSKVCGRDITSSQQLSKDEASKAIDAIEAAIQIDADARSVGAPT